jgi:hypothetical protein
VEGGKANPRDQYPASRFGSWAAILAMTRAVSAA